MWVSPRLGNCRIIYTKWSFWGLVITSESTLGYIDHCKIGKLIFKIKTCLNIINSILLTCSLSDLNCEWRSMLLHSLYTRPQPFSWLAMEQARTLATSYLRSFHTPLCISLFCLCCMGGRIEISFWALVPRSHPQNFLPPIVFYSSVPWQYSRRELQRIYRQPRLYISVNSQTSVLCTAPWELVGCLIVA